VCRSGVMHVLMNVLMNVLLVVLSVLSVLVLVLLRVLGLVMVLVMSVMVVHRNVILVDAIWCTKQLKFFRKWFRGNIAQKPYL